MKEIISFWWQEKTLACIIIGLSVVGLLASILKV